MPAGCAAYGGRCGAATGLGNESVPKRLKGMSGAMKGKAAQTSRKQVDNSKRSVRLVVAIIQTCEERSRHLYLVGLCATAGGPLPHAGWPPFRAAATARQLRRRSHRCCS